MGLYSKVYTEGMRGHWCLAHVLYFWLQQHPLLPEQPMSQCILTWGGVRLRVRRWAMFAHKHFQCFT